MRTFDLTTLNNAKSYLDITNTSHDDLIELLIKSATDFIENYCGRRLIETTYTNEKYDGTGCNYLLLKNYPVNSSNTFKLERNNAYDNTDDWEEINSDDYYIDYNEGIVTYPKGFGAKKQKYRVTYTAGYDRNSDDWMFDLEYVCLQLVSVLWNKRKAGGISNQSFGNFSVAFINGIEQNEMIKNVLDKYKKELPDKLFS